jgi:hypothetical protein
MCFCLWFAIERRPTVHPFSSAGCIRAIAADDFPIATEYSTNSRQGLRHTLHLGSVIRLFILPIICQNLSFREGVLSESAGWPIPHSSAFAPETHALPDN